ncbi:hypothetical protein L596_005771 [Steinernema carpocapsae]|uniref:Uncharacterized protein n=1 Tax=Steinernema carpocapsae TaxID=34508 RepID=A0A4U8V025_STECR|nr:hypothetical protein L596_005771 [Steinernema carpocapsae]
MKRKSYRKSTRNTSQNSSVRSQAPVKAPESAGTPKSSMKRKNKPESTSNLAQNTSVTSQAPEIGMIEPSQSACTPKTSNKSKKKPESALTPARHSFETFQVSYVPPELPHISTSPMTRKSSRISARNTRRNGPETTQVPIEPELTSMPRTSIRPQNRSESTLNSAQSNLEATQASPGPPKSASIPTSPMTRKSRPKSTRNSSRNDSEVFQAHEIEILEPPQAASMPTLSMKDLESTSKPTQSDSETTQVSFEPAELTCTHNEPPELVSMPVSSITSRNRSESTSKPTQNGDEATHSSDIEIIDPPESASLPTLSRKRKNSPDSTSSPAQSISETTQASSEPTELACTSLSSLKRRSTRSTHRNDFKTAQAHIKPHELACTSMNSSQSTSNPVQSLFETANSSDIEIIEPPEPASLPTSSRKRKNTPFSTSNPAQKCSATTRASYMPTSFLKRKCSHKTSRNTRRRNDSETSEELFESPAVPRFQTLAMKRRIFWESALNPARSCWQTIRAPFTPPESASVPTSSMNSLGSTSNFAQSRSETIQTFPESPTMPELKAEFMNSVAHLLSSQTLRTGAKLQAGNSLKTACEEHIAKRKTYSVHLWLSTRKQRHWDVAFSREGENKYIKPSVDLLDSQDEYIRVKEVHFQNSDYLDMWLGEYLENLEIINTSAVVRIFEAIARLPQQDIKLFVGSSTQNNFFFPLINNLPFEKIQFTEIRWTKMYPFATPTETLRSRKEQYYMNFFGKIAQIGTLKRVVMRNYYEDVVLPRLLDILQRNPMRYFSFYTVQKVTSGFIRDVIASTRNSNDVKISICYGRRLSREVLSEIQAYVKQINEEDEQQGKKKVTVFQHGFMYDQSHFTVLVGPLICID